MARQIPELQNHLTSHASHRMSERSIREWQVEQVLAYGRAIHNRKAVIYAVGRKEVKENGRFLEACEGIQVVCSPTDGTIITTYRNHNLSGMRR